METNSRKPIALQIPDESGVPVSTDLDKAPRYNITPLKGFSVYNSEGDVLYKGAVEEVAAELRQVIYRAPAVAEIEPIEVLRGRKQRIAVSVKKKGYTKKRYFPLIIILIINIAALLVSLASLLGEPLNKYFAAFTAESANGSFVVSFYDGFIGVVKHFITTSSQTVLNYDLHADTLSWVMSWMFAICSCVVLVFSVAQVIISIVAICSRRRSDGYYVKHYFGGTAVAMLIFFLAEIIGLAFGQGQVGFGDLANLFLLKEFSGAGIPRGDLYVLYPGYGVYIVLGATILTMILSAWAYGKKKEKNK